MRVSACRFMLAATAICALWLAPPLSAQQRADDRFDAVSEQPAFAPGTGPRLAIDEAHGNFHTRNGRYAPFARLAESDGYRVMSWTRPFDRDALATIDILVIANALHADTVGNWAAEPKSAFPEAEIQAVGQWVREDGGALVLIADHQPFPAAAAALAREFGFLFYNGYLLDNTRRADRGTVTFSVADGSLRPHPIVHGRTTGRPVPALTVFTGQAFLAPPEATPLMVLGPEHYLYLPGPDRKITPATPAITAERWLQGAVLETGRGRVAMLGEAAAFTAQTSSRGRPMGMGHPLGQHNDEFVLNLLHWVQDTKSHPASAK